MLHSGVRTIVGAWVLVAVPAVSGDTSVVLMERLETISLSQGEARRRFAREFEGKTTAEAQKPALERFYAATARNTGEILTLVQAHPGDPAVLDALRFVIDTARAGPGDESYRAMEILLRDHVRDPGMGHICARIFYLVHAPIAEALIRAVLAHNPNRYDRGLACHMLATYLRGRALMVRQIRERPDRIDHYVHDRFKPATERIVKESDPERIDLEAESLLERVIAEYADIVQEKAPRPLGTIAAGELFDARHLSVGNLVPDIVGRDHEGKEFRLGDSRGKVIVLTFSGNWCGPCVAMYPQERELVTSLKEKPFALLCVNTDTDVNTLRKSIASGEISWRCWWDGGTQGPITTRWGISSFPSIFVIDRSGNIRFKDLRGADLDRAVKVLLEEGLHSTSPGAVRLPTNLSPTPTGPMRSNHR